VKYNVADMSQTQFSSWLMPIVDRSLFESRERLMTLLSQNANRDALETEFREFMKVIVVWHLS
jgi:hypothetical protein